MPGRSPGGSLPPEGFVKCAACVWSRRATGYCYLKHDGGQAGGGAERALPNDGATSGDRCEGVDGEGPLRTADKLGEGGADEQGGAPGGSETTPEKASAGDKATPNKLPTEPTASTVGSMGDEIPTEPPFPAEAVKESESAEKRGGNDGKEVGEAENAEVVGGKGHATGGTEDGVQKGDAAKEEVQLDDVAGAVSKPSEKETGGRTESAGGGVDATDNGNAEGGEKTSQNSLQTGGKEDRGAENGQPVAGAVSGLSGSGSDPVTAEPRSEGEAQGGSAVPAGMTVEINHPSAGSTFPLVNERPRGKRKDGADEKGPGRPKPCNACRKVRKGGCGTPRAYSGCEVWKPEVREWPRTKGGERELRPWPAHLPPEAHAQVRAGASDPSRADPGANTASKIPYLYFGRTPSELDPGSENGLGISPAPYSRLTPASYLSRLNQSSSVPSAPPFVDLFAKPPLNLQTQNGSVPNPGPGPLSQQVSQLFSPPHAALSSYQPDLRQLPPIAQLIGVPTGVSIPVVGNGVRKPGPSEKAPRAQTPQSAPSRSSALYAGVPVKVLNPNARTPDANPVVPLSVLPVQLQIPELPVFRTPPTTSIGAQLPAPRLSSSNQPLLGGFLRGREPFTGGQPSTDVIRIRGGGPRPRKRKQTERVTGGEAKKARKVAEKKDGDHAERLAEATAGGGTDAGMNSEVGPGNKEPVVERGAAEGGSGVTPEREELRRSSRVRQKGKTEVANQAEESPSGRREAGVRGGRKTAAKASTKGVGSSRRASATQTEDGEGGKARRGRRRKPTAVPGKKGTSEGEGEGRKGRTTGAEKRRQGAERGSGGSQAGGTRTAPAKKARGGAKGKGCSGKAPLIVFAHGAGAGASSPFMQRWRDLLKDATGAVDVVTFDYPYLAGGKKGAPPKAEKLVDFHIETIEAARKKHPGAPLVLVGKSMGSRVSCMIGGREDSGLDVAAVVCLGYPLKGMGKGPLREQPLLNLRCPVLFVQGSKDSMCPLDSLADVRERMSVDNDLYVMEGGDHGLSVGSKALAAQGLTKEEAEAAALEAIASFLSPLF